MIHLVHTCVVCGGLAQFATSVVASTKLTTPGPVSTWMADRHADG